MKKMEVCKICFTHQARISSLVSAVSRVWHTVRTTIWRGGVWVECQAVQHRASSRVSYMLAGLWFGGNKLPAQGLGQHSIGQG